MKRFFKKLRMWVFWDVTATHEEKYHCAQITFRRRYLFVFLLGEHQTYKYDINELQYLYDLEEATLRHFEYLLESEKARRNIKRSLTANL